MFLMFGMQYLLSGGYCLREDSHVRVDVIYERFSERTKAIIDLVTSIFFFIFTVTLLVTGYIFAAEDRKSVVSGKSVSVRVALGGRRIIKKKKKRKHHTI